MDTDDKMTVPPIVPPSINEDLEKLVNNLVAKKVDEKFQEIELKVEACLRTVKENLNQKTSDRATIVVFSGDFDKLIAAFIIATGASAMAMEVSMFFTFWGLTSIKKQTIFSGKSVPEKMIAAMLPKGPEYVGTSKMNMLGLGPAFFKYLMKKQDVASLPDLIETAREMDIRLVACEMSMGIMGIKPEELLDDIEFGGVAAFIGDASDSKLTLFI